MRRLVDDELRAQRREAHREDRAEVLVAGARRAMGAKSGGFLQGRSPKMDQNGWFIWENPGKSIFLNG